MVGARLRRLERQLVLERAEQEVASQVDRLLLEWDVAQCFGRPLPQPFEFVNGIPKYCPWTAFRDDEDLFEKDDPGTAFDRAVSQLKMIISGSREGGFFIVIGRKRSAP